MGETISVLVIAIRPVTTADGLLLHELTVIDQKSFKRGTMVLSPTAGRELLGDCPTSDLVDVDSSAIAWRT